MPWTPVGSRLPACDAVMNECSGKASGAFAACSAHSPSECPSSNAAGLRTFTS